MLSLLFIAFGAFLLNTYELQKNYFESKNIDSPEPLVNDVLTRPKTSLYSDYSKDNFDKALASDSVLVLYFTSNWCSECTKQDTTNQEVFDEIGDQGLVFLKVHILDSETTSESDALAKKFDIVKENSYVVLDKKGAVAFKSMGSIEKETLKIKILEAGDTK